MSDPGSATPVTYERQDDIALVRLDDGKANALTHGVIEALHDALDRAESDGVGAVVLTGRQGRFCAGFDLKTMQAGPDQARDLLRAGAELGLRIYRFPVPVLLAVNGHALAMGAILLMFSDVRFGARGEFKLGLNEVAIGMPVPKFVTELATDRLSRRHLTAAVNHARIFDPGGAVDAGFLDETMDMDSLLVRTIDHAHRLAGTLNRDAFRITRDHLRGESARRIEAGLAQDVEMFKLLG